MKKRDLTIDFLRFVGLSLIIIAHVQAPYDLTQIRCFDVPMMLFISGLTSSGKPSGNYVEYILKRTKRLILPVWIFLFFYLASFYFAQSFVLPEQYLTWDMIWRSFLLLDKSIGYVWIIRVFLLVMLVTPPILWFVNRFRRMGDTICLLIALGCLLIATNSITEMIQSEGFYMIVVRDIVQYTIAYSIPFVAGVFIKSIELKRELLFLALLSIIAFVVYYFYSQEYTFPRGISEKYKFPPQIYYITYGTLVSTLLWSTRPLWSWITKFKPSIFIGQNTIWIYLWHMPFALFATVFMHNWCIKYIFVYGAAIFCFYCQNLIVRKMPNNRYKSIFKG